MRGDVSVRGWRRTATTTRRRRTRIRLWNEGLPPSSVRFRSQKGRGTSGGGGRGVSRGRTSPRVGETGGMKGSLHLQFVLGHNQKGRGTSGGAGFREDGRRRVWAKRAKRPRSTRRMTTMPRGHLPGHEPLGVLRVPLLLAPLPGHEWGWLGRRVRRHRGRRRVRRRGRSATGVVYAGHASRSSRCVANTFSGSSRASRALERRPFRVMNECRADPSWMNEFSNCAVRRRRARARGSRRRWANGRGFWTHEGVDATHAMCARRSGCATG